MGMNKDKTESLHEAMVGLIGSAEQVAQAKQLIKEGILGICKNYARDIGLPQEKAIEAADMVMHITQEVEDLLERKAATLDQQIALVILICSFTLIQKRCEGSNALVMEAIKAFTGKS